MAIALNSLKNQEDLTAVEIIVVDNGSTDNTASIAEKYLEEIPSLSYLYNAEPGLLTGRHAGAEIAKGEILCYLDDDVEVNPFYCKNVMEVFAAYPNAKLATGPCIGKFEIDPPNWLSYFWIAEKGMGKYCEWLSLLDFGNTTQTIHPNFVWGLNFAIRKETLFELGGFHPDCIPQKLQKYQGDGESGLTMTAALVKYEAIYYPGMKLYHEVGADRLTITYFKKRAFYKGVCNSYTNFRTGNTNNDASIDSAYSVSMIRTLINKVHRFRKGFRNYWREKPFLIPKEIKDLKALFDEAYEDGFSFHQNALKDDEKLREWVLKENYWNYKLPNHD